MLDVISSVLAFIVAIGVLVSVHEYGHFWVARRLGFKVLRFSVGFGKPLLRWRGRPTQQRVASTGSGMVTEAQELEGPEYWLSSIPPVSYTHLTLPTILLV